jgi:hypothetical protein
MGNGLANPPDHRGRVKSIMLRFPKARKKDTIGGIHQFPHPKSLLLSAFLSEVVFLLL